MKVTVSSTNPNASKTLSDIVRKLKGGMLKAGFPANAEGLGAPHYENGASIIQVAVWNQFGTDKTPSRPFMSVAKEKLRSWYPGFIQQSVRNLESFDAVKTMNLVGEYAKGSIQLAITEMVDPPNAPYTIRKKKSAHPLIDTGAMRQSVTYIVESD